MRELVPVLDPWLANGEKVALATVIQTWGSSPRGIGAKMALSPGGKITGSVSGGCVEGAVFEAGVETLQSGQPQLLHFGVADETAWQVGLACGGQIDVFVKPLEESFYQRVHAELGSGRTFGIATVIRGPADLLGKEILIGKDGPVENTWLSQYPELQNQIQAAIRESRSQTIHFQLSSQETGDVFIDVIQPLPLLVIVGGVHIAIALTSIAKTLGFRTVVVDPRKAFGSPERFSHADQLIKAWPDDAFPKIEFNERTAIAILTHDPKIDDPALLLALDSPAFYIGALGSETTQAKRRNRMLQAGKTEEQLARVHGPIGLRLGGTSPEEVALAIMAEIVMVQHSIGQPAHQPVKKAVANGI